MDDSDSQGPEGVQRPARGNRKRLNPVSQAHRDYFWQSCLYWQDRFGLSDWRLGFQAKPSRYLAEVSKFDLKARTARIALGGDFAGMPINEQTLSETACHELLHILFYEALHLAENDGGEEAVGSAEHRAINVLEKLLAPTRWI